MPRMPHARQYTNRKAMAKKSGYPWRLSQEEFEELARQPCTDCATTPCRGVYRKDVSGEAPFSADNCVPLCADCGRRRPKRPRSESKSSSVAIQHAEVAAALMLLRNLVPPAQPTYVFCPVPLTEELIKAMQQQQQTGTTYPLAEAEKELMAPISNDDELLDIPQAVLDEFRFYFNEEEQQDVKPYP